MRSSFGWSKVRSFSEGPVWQYRTFLQKVLREINGKNREISGKCYFWTLLKSNIPDVWKWNYWTLFGSEIEVRWVGRWCGTWPPCPHCPSNYASGSLPKDAKMWDIMVFHGLHLFRFLYKNFYRRKNRYSGTIFRSKFSFYTC